MPDEKAKHAIDLAAAMGGLPACFDLITGIVQFIVLLLSMLWFALRLINYFRNGRQPTAECARSCPLIQAKEDERGQ